MITPNTKSGFPKLSSNVVSHIVNVGLHTILSYQCLSKDQLGSNHLILDGHTASSSVVSPWGLIQFWLVSRRSVLLYANRCIMMHSFTSPTAATSYTSPRADCCLKQRDKPCISGSTIGIGLNKTKRVVLTLDKT